MVKEMKRSSECNLNTCGLADYKCNFHAVEGKEEAFLKIRSECHLFWSETPINVWI